MTSLVQDQQYQNVEFQSLSGCQNEIKAKGLKTCQLKTDDFLASRARVSNLVATDIIVNNIGDPVTYRTDSHIEYRDMYAVDSFSSLGGAGLNSVEWVLEAAYIQTNNMWTDLGIVPYSSGPLDPASLTTYPVPQNNLYVEFIAWLNTAFQNTGIHSSHGFTAFPNSKYIPSTGGFTTPRYRLGALAHLPNGDRILNWALVLRRIGTPPAPNPVETIYYVMTAQGTIGGGQPGSEIFLGFSLPVGLPSDPTFWTGFNVISTVPYQNEAHTEYAMYFSI